MQPYFRQETTSIRWTTPVDIRIPEGGHRVFHGPCEALCYLVHECHTLSGMHYETAKNACIDALKHTRDAEQARQAFLQAITEGHLPIPRH